MRARRIRHDVVDAAGSSWAETDRGLFAPTSPFDRVLMFALARCWNELSCQQNLVSAFALSLGRRATSPSVARQNASLAPTTPV